MVPLNHKRTTSSLAPPIICVAKKSAISGTHVKSEEGESETDEGSLPNRRRRQSSGSSFTMPSTSSADLTPGKSKTKPILRDYTN